MEKKCQVCKKVYTTFDNKKKYCSDSCAKQANKKKIKVAVHDGAFHPDDVCSVAILSLFLNKPVKIFIILF